MKANKMNCKGMSMKHQDNEAARLKSLRRAAGIEDSETLQDMVLVTRSHGTPVTPGTSWYIKHMSLPTL
jgi:hypothetical protein